METNHYWLVPEQANHILSLADSLATSDCIPKQYQGKPANIFIALQLAFRFRIDPMMVLSKSYVVHGRIGLESQLQIAIANKSKAYSGRINWRWSGKASTRDKDDGWSCIASVFCGEQEVAEELTWYEVKSNGWDRNEAWKRDPRLMMQYRSATRLLKLHFPEVTMGLYTREELVDDFGEDNSTQHNTWSSERVARKQPRALPMIESRPPELVITDQTPPVQIESNDTKESGKTNRKRELAKLLSACETRDDCFDALEKWIEKHDVRDEGEIDEASFFADEFADNMEASNAS
tara:strand:+ start:4492 stop:5367 length:876 start_codon:yes stop_codon:yes gene_type:complete